ncbi:MAG: DUF61 family protein [Candidatus Methanomethylophilaceae archaeon]
MIGDALHIEKELMRMNVSTPVARRTIREHLDSGDLTFRTKDGCTCDITPEELQYLDGICTEMEKFRIRLPILVSTDASGEGTAWRVDGPAESAAVARILGKQRRKEDSVRFFNPDLKKLRGILPNCIFIVYSL